MSSGAGRARIYALQLKEGRYYVGKTNRTILQRVEEHRVGAGSGASWTKRYPPIDILDVRDEASPLDEDTLTKEYMIRFGIDNVRGGTYCSLELSTEDRQHLRKEIWSSEGRCIQCGRAGHYAAACSALTTVDGEEIGTASSSTFSYSSSTSSSSSSSSAAAHADVWARQNHDDRSGNSASARNLSPRPASFFSPSSAQADGRDERPAVRSYKSVPASRPSPRRAGNSASSRSGCARCGRDSHTASRCYAKTDVDGEYLDSESEDDSDEDGYY